MNEALLRLHNILNFPLINRCDEVRHFVKDCGTKELQAIFPLLLESIFATGQRANWGLCIHTCSASPKEYNALVGLLNTKGAMFDLIYRLMFDCYLRYEFNFLQIPQNVRKGFEEDLPPFYNEKISLDPHSRLASYVALNPFEYYMYHFAFYLIQPWVSRTASLQGDTVYSNLVEDYLMTFLPCDGSPVCPPIEYFLMKTSLPKPQTSTTPMQVPTLFRPSMLAKQTPSGLHSPPTTPPVPHMEVWRTETTIQAFTDMWLSFSMEEGNGTSSLRDPPSVERLRMVRLLVKHLHYFSNTAEQDLSPMGEVKSAARRSTGPKVYRFLRRTINEWPLDGSFRIVLETWLSYIQPWRYVGYNRPTRNTALPDDAPRMVDISWMNFVLENLFAYTVIFQQLIPRFSRLDLTAPRNAHMLHRLAKVFSQTNLNVMIAEGESFLGGPVPKQMEGMLIMRHVHQSVSKWNAYLRQKVQELEGPHFEYTFVFDNSSDKISELMQFVLESTVAARVFLQTDEQKRVTKTNSFWSWLWELFMEIPEDNQYSVEERRKVMCYLDMSLEGLASFFMLPIPSIPDVSSMSLKDIGALMRHDSGSFYELVNNSLMADSERQRALQGLQNRQSCLRYEGDPDLQPCRSSELAVLVWILYNISSKLNQMYGDEMTRLYYSEDFVGRIARQILCGPLVIRMYDKHSGARFARLVEKVLPPRLSLRRLASIGFQIRVLFSVLILWLFGFSLTSIVVIAIFVFVFWVLIRAAFEPVLGGGSPTNDFSNQPNFPPPPPPPFNISDISEGNVSNPF